MEKKGVFVNDNFFWEWFSQIRMNTIKRVEVIISLLDDTNKPVVTWQLANAFPCKIEGVGLNSLGNDVAIETLVIAHEGLTISNG